MSAAILAFDPTRPRAAKTTQSHPTAQTLIPLPADLLTALDALAASAPEQLVIVRFVVEEILSELRAQKGGAR